METAKPLQELFAAMLAKDIRRKYGKRKFIKFHFDVLQLDGMSKAEALDAIADSLRQVYTGREVRSENKALAIYARIANAAVSSIDFRRVARDVLDIPEPPEDGATGQALSLSE